MTSDHQGVGLIYHGRGRGRGQTKAVDKSQRSFPSFPDSEDFEKETSVVSFLSGAVHAFANKLKNSNRSTQGRFVSSPRCKPLLPCGGEFFTPVLSCNINLKLALSPYLALALLASNNPSELLSRRSTRQTLLIKSPVLSLAAASVSSLSQPLRPIPRLQELFGRSRTSIDKWPPGVLPPGVLPLSPVHFEASQSSLQFGDVSEIVHCLKISLQNTKLLPLDDDRDGQRVPFVSELTTLGDDLREWRLC